MQTKRLLPYCGCAAAGAHPSDPRLCLQTECLLPYCGCAAAGAHPSYPRLCLQTECLHPSRVGFGEAIEHRAELGQAHAVVVGVADDE